MKTVYENPTHSRQFDGRTALPVFGGRWDGATLYVPTMFGEIVPQFARIDNEFYQLLIHERRWRFSFQVAAHNESDGE